MLFKLADCYESLSRLDEADRIYRTIVAHYPESAYAFRADRRIASNLEVSPGETDWRRARSCRVGRRGGDMSIEPDPSTPLSREERFAYELGRRCFERGDASRALTYLERLLETRRGFADVHYMVGSLHERRDDLEAARARFEEALRINPAYTEALLALASLHERQGEYERSEELCERAARSVTGGGGLDRTTRGKLANLQAELADALREAGELGEAVEAYRKALERCPEFHDIRYRLGIALREAGRPDRALAEFRRVQAANPGFLEARVQLGVTLYTLGRAPEAVEAWESVLERQPTHPDAQMYLRLVAGPAPPPRSLSPG